MVLTGYPIIAAVPGNRYYAIFAFYQQYFMPDTFTDPLRYFHGSWQLERTIYTRSTGAIQATANGSAVFGTGTVETLLYGEEGKIALLQPGTLLTFHRRFLYHFTRTLMEVFFDDGPDTGRLYQVYHYQEATRKWLPSQAHLCGPDTYWGEYHLLGKDIFRHTTLIEGKAKDMLIETVYHRKTV